MNVFRILIASMLVLSVVACGDDDNDNKQSDASSGSVACTDVTESGLPNGCTMSYAKCSDSKTYQVDCTGNGPYSCQCKVNGAPEGLFDNEDVCLLNGSTERAVVSEGCGWKLK